MEKDAKIYLAGHNGMVGSAVYRHLIQAGLKKNLITRSFSELDLMDQGKVNDFFQTEKPHYVILCAAKVGGIKANSTLPADFLYQNLQIQNNVIWAAHEQKVKKLIFLGSSCIYPRECPQPMKEEYLLTGKLEPTNEGYALAKIAGMKLCEKIYEQFGDIFISCMPANIYGINDNFNPETSHVIPALMRRMHEAKENGADEVVIWGSGTSRREFLFVDDLADAVYWLMENYNEKQFLNIGTGVVISIKELAETIKCVVEYTGKLVFDKTKPDGMPKKMLDVSKMSKMGWQAETRFVEGLKVEYDWFRNNNGNK